jgi:isopenicillin N synthase-like dioxygenase
MDNIPVIDLSFVNSGISKAKTLSDLYQACSTAGFFYVANHGVDPALVKRCFEQAALLFDLPMEDKMTIHLRHSKCRRGYERIGDQTLDAAALPDQKESYYCGVEYPASHPYVVAGYDTYGQSQWPIQLPHFAPTMTRYIEAHVQLCKRLLSLIAESLQQSPDYFAAATEDPMISLRMVRYPPHPEEADARLFGAGAHTDWGALTTLAQDDIGGLQVQLSDGRWIAVPPIPDTFVVNLGDMMPRWTNDLFRSNPHRVVNANFEAKIEPMPGTVSAERPRRYPTCTAGEHLKAMVQKTYGDRISAPVSASESSHVA